MEDTRLQPHSSQCPEENTAHYNDQEATACGHRAEFSQALRQLNENTYELESSRNGHMIWAYYTDVTKSCPLHVARIFSALEHSKMGVLLKGRDAKPEARVM